MFVLEHAEGHAGFEAEFVHAFNHVNQRGHGRCWRAAPCAAHAESHCAGFFGFFGGGEDFVQRHEFFTFEAGVVVRGLRAVAAVFGAGAGFDVEQHGFFDFFGFVVREVDGLRLVDQTHQRLFVQCGDFGECVVVA